MKEGCLWLEQFAKELNCQLEKIRNKFPRLYFVSNDELIEICDSELKDVQPHMAKVY